MKKQIILIVLLLISSTYPAQVGINTSNPQTVLHVDGAKDNSETGVPTAAQQLNDAVVTSAGNLGIGTITPTEKLDISSGNLRVRNINSNVGIGGTDKVVVADATGVLKTIDFTAYSLFHARLAAEQSIPTAASIVTLLFASPLATSPFYSYNTSSGVLTFNQPGNYLITLQSSFGNIPSGAQLLLGIRPIPDANYLGRGSHYAGATPPVLTASSRIGELMSYTTLLVIPTAGYQIRFTASANDPCTILSTEIGSTGNGNVTNVTVQKI